MLAVLGALMRETEGVAQRETGRKRAKTPDDWIFLELMAIIKHAGNGLFYRRVTLFGGFFDLLHCLGQRFSRPTDLTLKLAFARIFCICRRTSRTELIRHMISCLYLCLFNHCLSLSNSAAVRGTMRCFAILFFALRMMNPPAAR